MLSLLCKDGIAGAWPNGKGHFYAKISHLRFSNQQTFNEQGTKRQNISPDFLGALGGVFEEGTFESAGFSFYGEAGVSSRIDVIFQLYSATIRNKWRFAKEGNPDIVQENQGLQTLTVGMKYNFFTTPVIFSVRVLGSVPTYRNNQKELNIEPEDLDFYDNHPALGNGAATLSITPQLGYAFKHLPLWLELEGGIRFRANLFSDELPFRLQLGYKFRDSIYLATSVDAVRSLGNGAWPNFFRNEIGKGPFLINDQEHLNVSMNAGFAVFGPVWLEAEYVKTVTGKRTPAGQTFNFGISVKH